MPERIVSDNALNLNNNTISEVCSQFKIKHHNSSRYRLKMNGAVEAANKNMKKIHEKLSFALYAYRTSVKTSTGATSFSLIQSRYDQLNLIEEKRIRAIRHGQIEFHDGDLVLKRILPIQMDFKEKWTPNWTRAYMVKKAFSRRALILAEIDGRDLPNPANSDSIKRRFT
ncbi:RNA-directed DNA polymerase (Reverse transcriptase), Ribonuclease H [Gossypium australe]|uniref:RNA-directed DNA polymerase (Reverse transcriptase), Ribonuclease H n=1 Tax=Gossypium australe TaxID=47621 RepID=A0A5B6VC20_9ROSI|nr:RNA-directed DNA polymerase (Reverse transcriptase), Ribonuclease H [Gossypium australe]